MKLITILWIIFALLFLSLAILHGKATFQKIPHFGAKPSPGVGAIDGIKIAKSGFSKFVPEFNEYIDQQNASSRQQNILAVIGYFLAFITAVLSAFLTKDNLSEIINKISIADIINKLKKRVVEIENNNKN